MSYHKQIYRQLTKRLSKVIAELHAIHAIMEEMLLYTEEGETKTECGKDPP